MKKKRNLDRDGLDGILPDLSKGLAASVSASSREATAAKPRRAKVIPLFTALGALVAAALWLDRYVPTPSVVGADSLASTTGSGAGTDSKQSGILAPSPAIADGGREEPVAAASPNQIAQSSNAQPGRDDILAQLPTEPTAAGIQQIPAEPAMPRFRNSAPYMPVLATVYFKFDSSKPVSRHANEFDDLFNSVKRCSEITLTGHTCNLGSHARNQQLGLARADALKKLLVRRGYAAEGVFTASAGMNEPAASNDTKAGQALNRRVVVQCLQAVN